MQKVIAKVKNSKGFVSIEFVLIAGSVVILAALVLFFFNGKANDITVGAGEQLTIANEKMNGEDPTP